MSNFFSFQPKHFTNQSPTQSPKHSPNNSAKLRSNQIKKNEKKQAVKNEILSSPIKYLLQNNIKFNIGKQSQRSAQEIDMIAILLKESLLFKHLGLNIQDKGLRKELCNGILLIYCESPHIMQIKDNEIYIFLEGQGFEYMQNNLVNEQSKKYKFYQDNEYIMLRKIQSNEYFLSLQESNARNTIKQKKYQLMVDQNTLIGKYSNQIFYKVFLNRIVQREKAIVNYIKKIDIFTGLAQSFYQELSKFLIDQNRNAEQKLVSPGEKNKFVYFVKSGQVEIKYQNKINDSPLNITKNHHPHNAKQSFSERVTQNQLFGMDSAAVLNEDVQKQIICLTNCSFYKIDKRLLAIIITSFNLQNQNKKFWSQINMNNQIKGQNSTAEQELLIKNATRIKTTEKKIRDIKLRFLSLKKSKNPFEQINESQAKSKQLQQERLGLQTMRVYSTDQQKRMLKTADGRFRSTANLLRYGSNLGILQEQKKYNELRKHLNYQKEYPQNIANQISIIPFDLQYPQTSHVNLRMTNSYTFREKAQQSKRFRNSSHKEKQTSSAKFIPKLQIKTSSNVCQSFKGDSDMIGLFIDKKIKNQVVRKAQKVLQLNKNLKSIQTRNLKRLFNSNKNYNLNAISDHEKKSIADDIVQKMTNMRDNPLLLQIESERRKMERNLKLAESKRPKVESPNKRIKKEDFNIMIKNNQE